MPQDEYTKFAVSTTEKSGLVSIIGDPSREGYKTVPYEIYPKQGSKKYVNSGVAVGNGVDFGAQSADKFRKLGIPEYLINKIETYGLFGLKDKKARDKVAEYRNAGTLNAMFNKGEVALMSNVITADSARPIIADVGIDKWNTYSSEEQALAVMLSHQYTWKDVKNFESYGHWKNKEWPQLRNSLENWKDSTPVKGPAIEARWGRAVDLLPAKDPVHQIATPQAPSIDVGGAIAVANGTSVTPSVPKTQNIENPGQIIANIATPAGNQAPVVPAESQVMPAQVLPATSQEQAVQVDTIDIRVPPVVPINAVSVNAVNRGAQRNASQNGIPEPTIMERITGILGGLNAGASQ